MAIDLTNGYRELKAHLDHEIVCDSYGNDDENIAITCETCNCILIDFNEPSEGLDPDNLTRDKVISILATRGVMSFQDRVMKNTGNVRECMYVDGQLAAKESGGGVYRLCNEFADLI